jgi:hypothetical protein
MSELNWISKMDWERCLDGETMDKAGSKGGTTMNDGFKFAGLVSFIMTVANVCFALYEENNNGIYAEFAVLWFFMMIAMFVLDELSDRS